MSPSAPTPDRIRRFSTGQRMFHLLLLGVFLTQAVTGLARMFIETRWGQWLAWLCGGYDAAREIHIVVGVLMLAGMALHAVYLLTRIDWRQPVRSLTGPDSLLPRPRDLTDFFRHVAWMAGLGAPPRFDRWGYWEKFDYWAVFWGMAVMGATGVLLAWPLAASRIMPGWGLNVMFWIHRIEAVLAMGHVFLIHFSVAHLRRHNFPMDRAIFEGSADLRATREERADWVARLEGAGALEERLVPAVGTPARAGIYILGYAAVVTGVALLIGSLLNAGRITW